MRARRFCFAAVAAVAATVCSLVLAPGVAQGHASFTVIATGLDNPRGLAFAPHGALYVAESGRGGAGPCLPGPEGGDVCFGDSGAITRIGKHGQSRVITGLPSLAAPDGADAIGPSDVSFKGNGRMYFTVGLGADPALRAQLPPLGQQASGWLLRDADHKPWRQVADIAGYEAAANPDGGVVDSNPNSVLAVRGGQVVVDAGGNSLLHVSKNGTITTLAVFPDQLVDAPAFLGMPPGTQIPMQAVPTSVTLGPDGAYYVGQLTGFPFPVGAAKVFRVVPGQAPTVYAEGFTNIIDIGFDHRGRLHVLEIAHNGLLSGDTTGALIRVRHDGSQRIVASAGLHTPGGLAIRHGFAFVSNCGTCVGTGEVVRIPLH